MCDQVSFYSFVLCHSSFSCAPSLLSLSYLCYLVCCAYICTQAHAYTLFRMFPVSRSLSVARLIFEFRNSVSSTCPGHGRAGQNLKYTCPDANIRNKETLFHARDTRNEHFPGLFRARCILPRFCRTLFSRIFRSSLRFLFFSPMKPTRSRFLIAVEFRGELSRARDNFTSSLSPRQFER